jgi:hypothetical protein
MFPLGVSVAMDESLPRVGSGGIASVTTVDVSTDDAVFCRFRGSGGGISIPESSLISPSLIIFGWEQGNIDVGGSRWEFGQKK